MTTAESIQSAGSELATRATEFGGSAVSSIRSGVDMASERLPGLVEDGATATSDVLRSLRELPDDRLILVATFSLGLGIGLWLAGAPRLVTLAAFSPAIVMGLASASRAGAMDTLRGGSE